MPSFLPKLFSNRHGRRPRQQLQGTAFLPVWPGIFVSVQKSPFRDWSHAKHHVLTSPAFNLWTSLFNDYLDPRNEKQGNKQSFGEHRDDCNGNSRVGDCRGFQCRDKTRGCSRLYPWRFERRDESPKRRPRRYWAEHHFLPHRRLLSQLDPFVPRAVVGSAWACLFMVEIVSLYMYIFIKVSYSENHKRRRRRRSSSIGWERIYSFI